MAVHRNRSRMRPPSTPVPTVRFMCAGDYELWDRAINSSAKIRGSHYADAATLRTNLFVMAVIVGLVFEQRNRAKTQIVPIFEVIPRPSTLKRHPPLGGQSEYQTAHGY